MTKNNINGWLVIDKPGGITSAKVVARVKNTTKAMKVGHAGTLDPMASGILPIALGEATKTVMFMSNASKTYKFTVMFGKATDTDDAEGKVIEESDKVPTHQEIEAALPAFIGKIEQIPPSYSAIKVNGKRSYDLAREGKAEELKARIIQVNYLKLLNFHGNIAEFEMDCGKGTYVRSIARDLSRKLGTCGHVTVLRRTRVGNFCEEDAILLENLEKMLHIAPPVKGILPVEAVLDDIPVLHLNQSSSEDLRNGRFVIVKDGEIHHQVICAMNGGKLVAIAKIEGDRLKPVRVFNH